MSKIGNYVVGQEEELDFINSEWEKCFNETRAIRKEIDKLNDMLVKATNEFEKIDRIWAIYEKSAEAGL